MTDLNLYTWFSQRELQYCLPHFVVVDTLVTVESKHWILEKLTGRFCLVEAYVAGNPIYSPYSPYSIGYSLAFEIPQEATYFQLIWS